LVERAITGIGSRILAAVALVASLWAGAARAQDIDCQRLRAILSAPAQRDPQTELAAGDIRAKIGQMIAHANAIGCENKQFLFFGSPPPPECGGLKARIGDLRAQLDNQAASGVSGNQRAALLARYNASCRGAGNPFGTDYGEIPGETPQDANAPGRGSQAVCVRTCDGGFFPLPVSARSAGTEQLQELCQALCPNVEVKLFTRSPSREISTAVAPNGEAYEDLPNALAYTKKYDAACTCRPAGKSWVETLAHADDVLSKMGGARAGDQTVSEQQAKALSQPKLQKPGKTDAPAPIAAAPVVASPAKPAPAKPGKVLENPGPDGASRPVRVVGPQL
jgi:hypothetical protein